MLLEFAGALFHLLDVLLLPALEFLREGAVFLLRLLELGLCEFELPVGANDYFLQFLVFR